MNIMWTEQIDADNLWEPNLFGHFFRLRETVCFIFKDWSRLCVVSNNTDKISFTYFEVQENTLMLPSHWVTVSHGNTDYLFVGKNLIIDLSRMKVTSDIPQLIKSKYLSQVKELGYYENKSFDFGPYCIMHEGQSGYVCVKDGQQIWTFKGRAYLYTDILRWENRLFFGTAGTGGYFYVLDIDSGEPIAQIKTGGTSSIVHAGRYCYVLRNNKTALLCVDLQTGSIQEEIPLKGKTTSDSRIQLIDNQLHAISFEYSNGTLRNAVWSCVRIS